MLSLTHYELQCYVRTRVRATVYGMVWYGMVWYGMVEVCEGAPMAMGGWVLTDRHNLASCAAVCRCLGKPYMNDNWYVLPSR